MDRLRREPAADELRCPYCNPEGREIIGPSDNRRARRMKCRKCDAEYWENQASGMLQLDEVEE